jgi:hypothetical protein
MNHGQIAERRACPLMLATVFLFENRRRIGKDLFE